MMETMVTEIEEGTFEGFDGEELFFQTWPVKDPQAIIIGIHGLGEHSESYKRLSEGLKGSPYQLIMSDLRGHGRSAGKRGVGTIDEFVLDNKLFCTLVRARYPKLPFFFLSHSLGGLVLTKLLIRNGDMGAVGAVFSSPLMGVTVDIPPLKRKSASFLGAIAPNITLSNEIPNANLTHDKAVIAEYENDLLRHNRISPRLFISILQSVEYVFAQEDKIKLPVLYQLSGDDKVVSEPKAEQFYNNLEAKDKEKIVYTGFLHEIYNETERQRPFGDLKKWLEKHMRNR
jgi:alpha-beta hydrolase superfamily lysophospholipase